jgi:hypothetical protein
MMTGALGLPPAHNALTDHRAVSFGTPVTVKEEHYPIRHPAGLVGRAVFE